jgi:hypothetical protein
MFGDYLRIGAVGDDRQYEEVTSMPRLSRLLEEYLDEFNMASNSTMKLVRPCRVAHCRRAPRFGSDGCGALQADLRYVVGLVGVLPGRHRAYKPHRPRAAAAEGERVTGRRGWVGQAVADALRVLYGGVPVLPARAQPRLRYD